MSSSLQFLMFALSLSFDFVSCFSHQKLKIIYLKSKMQSMEFHCIFQSILDCSDMKELVEAQRTLTCQDKVKQCSERRNDNFYETLGTSNVLYYHQNYCLMYTSNNRIERYLKRKNQNQEGSCVKRSKRSSTTFLDFKKDCLIYGEACNIGKDKKHPER